MENNSFILFFISPSLTNFKNEIDFLLNFSKNNKIELSNVFYIIYMIFFFNNYLK